MKKKISAAFCVIYLIVLHSCSTNSQLFETKPLTANSQDSESTGYVLENDTLKIEYNFWKQQGEMSFVITNKMTIPIYIDWKKSAFVRNENKRDYYVDIEITNSTINSKGTTIGGGYIYFPNGKRVLVTSSEGQAYITSQKSRPERITFIPPNAHFEFSKYNFVSMVGFDLYKDSSFNTASETFSGEMIKMKSKSFTSENTPITFRNFLTYSTTENFEKENYVNNGFYVSQVWQMKTKEFRGRDTLNAQGFYMALYPYYDPTRFYIEPIR